MNSSAVAQAMPESRQGLDLLSDVEELDDAAEEKGGSRDRDSAAYSAVSWYGYVDVKAIGTRSGWRGGGVGDEKGGKEGESDDAEDEPGKGDGGPNIAI